MTENLVISKNSTNRKLIIDFLTNNPGPKDYCEIQNFIKTVNPKVNKTTIYRQLESLKKLGKISETDFGEGKKRFEITTHHHHHLMCQDCQRIDCIEVEDIIDKKLMKKINQKNFKITDHIFEIIGICSDCQKETKKC